MPGLAEDTTQDILVTVPTLVHRQILSNGYMILKLAIYQTLQLKKTLLPGSPDRDRQKWLQ